MLLDVETCVAVVGASGYDYAVFVGNVTGDLETYAVLLYHKIAPLLL